jgi:hypothetical protein
MAAFAAWLHMITRQPVQDATNLDGAWDFDLQYPYAMAGAENTAPFDAVASLGLKIEEGQVPQTVFTVASVDTATLVAEKPKLTKADPAERTGCEPQVHRVAGAFGAPMHLCASP